MSLADSAIYCPGRGVPTSSPAAGTCRSFPATAVRRKSGGGSTNSLPQRVNRQLGLGLTDAFCGFKAYRVPVLAKFSLTEMGYAMPLELWVQAVALGLKIVEMPVPLIYLDEARSFGGALDHGQTRLKVYEDVLDRAIAEAGIIPQTTRVSAESIDQGAAL